MFTGTATRSPWLLTTYVKSWEPILQALFKNKGQFGFQVCKYCKWAMNISYVPLVNSNDKDRRNLTVTWSNLIEWWIFWVCMLENRSVCQIKSSCISKQCKQKCGPEEEVYKWMTWNFKKTPFCISDTPEKIHITTRVTIRHQPEATHYSWGNPPKKIPYISVSSLNPPQNRQLNHDLLYYPLIQQKPLQLTLWKGTSSSIEPPFGSSIRYLLRVV